MTFPGFFRDRRGICKDREGSFGSFPCLKILVTFSGFSLEIVGRFIRIVQDRLYRLVQDSFKAFWRMLWILTGLFECCSGYWADCNLKCTRGSWIVNTFFKVRNRIDGRVMKRFKAELGSKSAQLLNFDLDSLRSTVKRPAAPEKRGPRLLQVVNNGNAIVTLLPTRLLHIYRILVFFSFNMQSFRKWKAFFIATWNSNINPL